MDPYPNSPGGELPQAEIERIADRIVARIVRALTHALPDDAQGDPSAGRLELPPGDVERVVAAVLARRGHEA